MSTDSARRAQRNADTLKNLQFAALKLDALGMRYQYAKEIAALYADALAHQHDEDRRITESDLSDISSTNGRLQDLRDYTTRLTELYRELWLNENLSSWLPNILQFYQRNGQMWQDAMIRFAKIQVDFR